MFAWLTRQVRRTTAAFATIDRKSVLDGLQIAALLAAAAWAVFAFSYSALPRFAPTFVGALQLSQGQWSPISKACVYEVSTDLTSKSIRSQAVDEVRYYASWERLPGLLDSDQMQLVDLYHRGREKDRLDRGRSGKSPLVFHYAPDQTTLDGFEIVTQPKPDHALLVILEVYQGNTMIDYFYGWQDSCEPPEEADRRASPD